MSSAVALSVTHQHRDKQLSLGLSKPINPHLALLSVPADLQGGIRAPKGLTVSE